MGKGRFRERVLFVFLFDTHVRGRDTFRLRRILSWGEGKGEKKEKKYVKFLEM